ncbi:histidine kinase [Streptomyces hundungensis]|uniref:histidine kinase n=1 Tax=Streptomyces hundungensis TaxID=1077946 RepID=UPI0033EB0D8F
MSQSLIVEAAAWAVGWSTRQGRAYTRGLVEQAEERAQLLLVEERMRIARELHVVVAHSLSIVAVQAGVGHHVSAAGLTRPRSPSPRSRRRAGRPWESCVRCWMSCAMTTMPNGCPAAWTTSTRSSNRPDGSVSRSS